MAAVRNRAATQPFSAVEKAIFWSPRAAMNCSMVMALRSSWVSHRAEFQKKPVGRTVASGML